MLFKKENIKRKGFSKRCLFNLTNLNSIYIYKYIFEFFNFYDVEKRKINFIICEIMKKFYFKENKE